jgi:hypothetical protein
MRVNAVPTHRHVERREGTDDLNSLRKNAQFLTGLAHGGIGQSLVLRFTRASRQRNLAFVTRHGIRTARERQHPLAPALVQE